MPGKPRQASFHYYTRTTLSYAAEFYAGATFVTKGHLFRTYNWAAADRLVQDMLGSYDFARRAVPHIAVA